MKFGPLTTEEAATQKFTHRLDYSYKDIPAGIPVTTDKVVTVAGLPVGTVIKSALLLLVTPFEDVSDATLDDTKISVGSTNNDDSIFNDVQLNKNGTEVPDSYFADLALLYTAAENLTFTLYSDSSTGFSLSNLDKGQFVLLLEIIETNRAAVIDNATP